MERITTYVDSLSVSQLENELLLCFVEHDLSDVPACRESLKSHLIEEHLFFSSLERGDA